jgi:phosphoribosyl-dephospho-CoA transferase
MKKFILLVLLTVFGMTANANPSPGSTSGNDLLVQAIRKAVKLPEELKNSITHERVLVVFTVTAAGEIKVVSVSSRNVILRKSITQQMQSIALNNSSSDSEKTYSIWLDFRVI